MATRPPKRLAGTERQRAKNVTQTVVWSTRGPKVRENIIYFEQSEKEKKNEPREGAKYITHSDIFGPQALFKTSWRNQIVIILLPSRKRYQAMLK